MSTYLIAPPENKIVNGTVLLNGSKSISNRVLIIKALCNQPIPIQNLSNADDTVFMQQLLQSDSSTLDAGAGGTTFRFLTAFLATQEGREVILTGSERMQQRPIKILVDALLQLGADISYVHQSGYPPLKIKGKQLKGGKIQLPADTSSQYITALLLIAPTLENGLELELIGNIVSLPYIKMTLKLMEYFGVETEFVDNKIYVRSGKYQAKPIYIEADWSAATYYYSMAILANKAKIELVGLTQQQLQGDAIITAIADSFGVETTWKENAICIEKVRNPDFGFYHFDFIECPDIAQTVLAFAAAKNISVDCNGLQTLRIKETDRIAAMHTELQKLGLASLSELNSNNWMLEIGAPPANHTSNSVAIHTYDDHRMAMAFAPLCLTLDTITIEEPNVVSKSYPLFWDDLKKLGFQITASN